MTAWVSVVREEKKQRTVVACPVDTYLCTQDTSRVSSLPADPYTLRAGHDIHPAPVYGAVVVWRRWACGRGVPASMQGTLYGMHAPGVEWRCGLLRVDEDEPGGCEDGNGGAVGGREGEGGAGACGGGAGVCEVGAWGVEVGDGEGGGEGERGERGGGRGGAEGGAGVDREGVVGAEEYHPVGRRGGRGEHREDCDGNKKHSRVISISCRSREASCERCRPPTIYVF